MWINRLVRITRAFRECEAFLASDGVLTVCVDISLSGRHIAAAFCPQEEYLRKHFGSLAGMNDLSVIPIGGSSSILNFIPVRLIHISTLALLFAECPLGI